MLLFYLDNKIHICLLYCFKYNFQQILMGTVCAIEDHRLKFKAEFTTNMQQSFQNYKKTIEYIRKNGLFKPDCKIIKTATLAYWLNQKDFDRSDPDILAVEATYKLHPYFYANKKGSAQWLQQACNRHYNFAKDFPLQYLDFDNSYKHYVEFLYICSKKRKQVIVPNKMADFMWHAHMQEHETYKVDTTKMVGRMLNHVDEYDKQQLAYYWKNTQKYKQKLLPISEKGGYVENPEGYGGFIFIKYGYDICGSEPTTIKKKDAELSKSKSAIMIEMKPTNQINKISVNARETYNTGGGASCGKGQGFFVVQQKLKLEMQKDKPKVLVPSKSSPNFYTKPKPKRKKNKWTFGNQSKNNNWLFGGGGCGGAGCCNNNCGAGNCGGGNCGGGGCGGGGCGGC